MPPRDNYNMSTLQEWEPLNHSFPELLAEIVPPCPGSLGWQCGIAGGGQLIQSPRGAGWARGEVPLGVWSSGLQPYFCSEPHGTFSKVSPDLIHWLVCESSKPWEDIPPCCHQSYDVPALFVIFHDGFEVKKFLFPFLKYQRSFRSNTFIDENSGFHN